MAQIKISEKVCLILGILLALSNSSLSIGERKIDPQLQQKIDSFIENVYLPRNNLPGVSLAIVQENGEILYTTGYGTAYIEKGIPFSNRTQSMIASTTKSVTATFVVKTLQQTFPQLGEKVLDTPIRKLIPQANFTLSDKYRSEEANFRDLLAMRTCGYLTELQALADKFESREESLYRARYNQPMCDFRGTFLYDNQMYTMAGALAASLLNKTFEDAMQDFFAEVGMTNATFLKKTDDFPNMLYRAQPYYIKGGQPFVMNPQLVQRIEANNPSGGLFLTPDDMSVFMRLHINLGRIDGKQLIPREVMEWLRVPSNVLTKGWFQYKNSSEMITCHRFGYGLGLFLGTLDSWEHIQHGGYAPPYNGLMSIFPELKLGIFSNTNYSPYGMDPLTLHSFVFHAILGNQDGEEKALKSMEGIAQDDLDCGIVEEKVNVKMMGVKCMAFASGQGQQVKADVVGQYGSGSLGDLEITERFHNQTNQTLYYLNYSKWFQGWLLPTETDIL